MILLIEGVKVSSGIKKLARAKTRKQREKLLAEAKFCICYAISEISEITCNEILSASDLPENKYFPYKKLNYGNFQKRL